MLKLQLLEFDSSDDEQEQVSILDLKDVASDLYHTANSLINQVYPKYKKQKDNYKIGHTQKVPVGLINKFLTKKPCTQSDTEEFYKKMDVGTDKYQAEIDTLTKSQEVFDIIRSIIPKDAKLKNGLINSKNLRCFEVLNKYLHKNNSLNQQEKLEVSNEPAIPNIELYACNKNF
jgi:hypothetical protein